MTETCRFCGEDIRQDEHGLWHHTSDDAVVCGFDKDGELQYASPRRADDQR